MSYKFSRFPELIDRLSNFNKSNLSFEFASAVFAEAINEVNLQSELDFVISIHNLSFDFKSSKWTLKLTCIEDYTFVSTDSITCLLDGIVLVAQRLYHAFCFWSDLTQKLPQSCQETDGLCQICLEHEKACFILLKLLDSFEVTGDVNEKSKADESKFVYFTTIDD